MTYPKETARALAREARLEWSHLARTLSVPMSAPFAAAADHRIVALAHAASDVVYSTWRALPARSRRVSRAGILSMALALVFTTSIPAVSPAYASPTTAAISRPEPLSAVPLAALASSTTTVVRHEDAHPYSTAPTSTRALTVRAWAAAGHPTAEQLAAGTADRPVNLIQVLAAAKALIGVPYRFGGETPNGFDCSGYVRFVYAQTGLLLPHSAKAQDAAGAPVDGSVARPGDLVIWNDDSHSAIYAGHGQIFHAPQPGGRVELVPIFTDAVHFVRVARD